MTFTSCRFDTFQTETQRGICALPFDSRHWSQWTLLQPAVIHFEDRPWRCIVRLQPLQSESDDPDANDDHHHHHHYARITPLAFIFNPPLSLQCSVELDNALHREEDSHGGEDKISRIEKLDQSSIPIAHRIVATLLLLSRGNTHSKLHEKMAQNLVKNTSLLVSELHGAVVSANHCILWIAPGMQLRVDQIHTLSDTRSPKAKTQKRHRETKRGNQSKKPSPLVSEEPIQFYQIHMSKTELVVATTTDESPVEERAIPVLSNVEEEKADGFHPSTNDALRICDNKEDHNRHIFRTHAMEKLHQLLKQTIQVAHTRSHRHATQFENILISGPSGCGKSFLVSHVCDTLVNESPYRRQIYTSVKKLKEELKRRQDEDTITNGGQRSIYFLILDDNNRSRSRRSLHNWLQSQNSDEFSHRANEKSPAVTLVISLIVTSSNIHDTITRKHLTYEFDEHSCWRHFSESAIEKNDMFLHIISQFPPTGRLTQLLTQFDSLRNDMLVQSILQKITIVRDLVRLAKEVFWNIVSNSSANGDQKTLSSIISEVASDIRLETVLSNTGGGTGGTGDSLDTSGIIQHIKIDHQRDSPKYTWDRIGGLDEVKRKLRQCVEWPLKYPDQFRKLNIAPSNSNTNNILLYGPPGCAKTTLVRTLVHQIPMIKHFYTLNSALLYSKYLGEAERYLRQLFKQARQHLPCVIFIDELDTIVANRNDGSDGGTSSSSTEKRILSTLLNEMDGIEQNVSTSTSGDDQPQILLIICATNRPDMIDNALMRPGRLDHLIYVTLPDYSTRQTILDVYLRAAIAKVDEGALLPELGQLVFHLASRTDKYTGADLEALVREALLNALVRSPSSDTGLLTIVQLKHAFEQALESIGPSVSDLHLYEQFENRFFAKS